MVLIYFHPPSSLWKTHKLCDDRQGGMGWEDERFIKFEYLSSVASMTNKKLLKLLVDCFKPFSLLFSLIALLLMTNINSFPQHHLFPTFFFLNSFISFSCAYAIASCWINNPHHEQRRQR